jgi:hypothetical protein
MLFRRRSRKDRILAATGRLMSSRRALATATGVFSGLAALTAASSSLSAMRRKQT